MSLRVIDELLRLYNRNIFAFRHFLIDHSVEHNIVRWFDSYSEDRLFFSNWNQVVAVAVFGDILNRTSVEFDKNLVDRATAIDCKGDFYIFLFFHDTFNVDVGLRKVNHCCSQSDIPVNMPVKLVTWLSVFDWWTFYLKVIVFKFDNVSSAQSFFLWIFLYVSFNQVNSTANIFLRFEKVFAKNWLRLRSTLAEARIRSFVIPSSTVCPIFHTAPNWVDCGCHIS